MVHVMAVVAFMNKGNGFNLGPTGFPYFLKVPL